MPAASRPSSAGHPAGSSPTSTPWARPHVLLAVGALLLAGCATPKSPGPTTVDLARAAQELFLTDQAFAAVSLERGSDAAFAEFTDDASVRIPAQGAVLRGGTTIARAMAPPEGMALTWTPESAEVARSGDMGWTYGTYEVLAAGEDGPAVVSTGRYLTVWRRGMDGRWKVAADIGNVVPP